MQSPYLPDDNDSLTVALTPATQRFLAAPRRHLVGANWTSGSGKRVIHVEDPASGSLLAEITSASPADLDAAVAAARDSFEHGWGRMHGRERARILLRLADLIDSDHERISQIMTLDNGMPITSSRAVVRYLAAELIRYYAGWATKIAGDAFKPAVGGRDQLDFLVATLREPAGVVGAIVPWNAPAGMLALKIAPALAAGCTLVLKPAEDASLTPLRFGELLLEAGVPPGVVNIVPGYGATAGAALASHMGVDKVSFTGSHVTGQQIVKASAGNLKRLSLELGGKSPNIVFADADIDRAAPAAAIAAFANAGQICSAGTRLYIQRPIFDAFVEAVAYTARNLKVGHGVDTETDIGPLVSKRQLERVVNYLSIGEKEGAHAIAGGRRLAGEQYDAGNFVPPTIFGNVRDDMRIAQEEIFGPVVAAIPFDTADEVVARANATPFGLGAGVWTRDVGRAHTLASRIRAGSVWVNCYNAMDPSMPFGGYKMSGYGRESGPQQLDDYLNVKGVWIRRD